ncbi:MAG TPA: FAD-dependent oxidoreductase, partial [Tepidisphaeraceae bacterium]|nr:FAD-dependent oxidoreductase [Tepidisphaeraceae bacterium]
MNRRIVIIGGVAGGMSAATRARRMNEHARIIVIERGGYISFANCGLPYYIGGAIKDAHKLLVTDPQRVKQRFNIDVRVRHEATGIDRAARTIDVQDLNSGRTFQLEYDKLILAPGAVPIVPAIAHVDAPNVFALRSMDDTRAIDQWIGQRQPRRAVVIGAGFVGLEMVEALHQRGMTVTVVEKMPHPLPPLDEEMAAPIAAELARHDVKLIVGSGLKALEAGSDGLVSAVEVEDGRVIPCDLVVMSIGVRPNVKLAQQAGLRIGSSGAIAVDCVQRTSDPDIYAVGDASEVIHAVTDTAVRIPLAGPANRQGRVAGEHAATGQALPAGKVLGTAIMKLFDLTVGITGLCERAARQAGFAKVDSAYVLPAHHAGYYPGAQQMRIKLVYDHAS